MPMKPRRVANIIYGDTPTFMEFPRADNPSELEDANVVFMGFPFEGTSVLNPQVINPPNGAEAGPDSIYFRTGTEHAPEWVRKWSIHSSIYNHAAYYVEHDIVLTDYLRAMDYGDAPCTRGQVVNSHIAGRQKVREIVEAGAIPLIQGGDHSVTIPGILGITDCISDNEHIGIIGFDAHFDLSGLQEGLRDWEKLNWSSQFMRALETPNVEPENIVLIGLKGLRNQKGWSTVAKKLGIRYFTLKEVDERGIEKVIEEAIERASLNTKHTYITIDIDAVDGAICPGQRTPDTPGLTPREIIKAIRLIGKDRVISGFDIACISPQYDVKGSTSLFSVHCFLEVLASLAVQFKNRNIKKWYI